MPVLPYLTADIGAIRSPFSRRRGVSIGSDATHRSASGRSFGQSPNMPRSSSISAADFAQALGPHTSQGVPSTRPISPSILNSNVGENRVESRYPRCSSDFKHVEHILVASFHTDYGPVMEQQYPDNISDEANALAELMLPDQTHTRSQDWTVFFLHNDAGPSDEPSSPRTRPSSESITVNSDLNDTESDDPPLLYVVNLVNTKEDTSAERGAVVKAMAICTRHWFFHIYKPVLPLALESYFKCPHVSTLRTLYDSLNAMDLSLMPSLRPIECGIIQSSNANDMFLEKFQRMIVQRVSDDRAAAVRMGSNPDRISTGGYPLPYDTENFPAKISYNGYEIPVRVPTATSPETAGDFSLVKLIMRFSAPYRYHHSHSRPFPLHPHLTNGDPHTHPIIVLVNALLTQKRVVFLGCNLPAKEVAESVLAACALASGNGILRGFTRYAFPYTDLTKVNDLLQIPGFVAGVTNPAWANHDEWWDLLCDLGTGYMTISSRIAPETLPSKARLFQAKIKPATFQGKDPMGNHAMMRDILHRIAERQSERVIRERWRSWLENFTRIAVVYEEVVYGTTELLLFRRESAELSPEKLDARGLEGHGFVWPDEAAKYRELVAWAPRIEGWRNTRSYHIFIQDFAARRSGFPRFLSDGVDLQYQHDRLRLLKLGHLEAAAIYTALWERIRDHESICQLLSVTPESKGGLFYVSLGLVHPGSSVREMTVDVLDRIAAHEAGKHFWARLNGFMKDAYRRVKREGRIQETKPRTGVEPRTIPVHVPMSI